LSIKSNKLLLPISRMRNSSIIKKSASYLMIAIIGLMIANKALYMHTHKMADGSIIVHAHPYNKSDDPKPFKSHQHTKIEFLFFANLEILVLISFMAFTSINIKKKVQYTSYICTNYTRVYNLLYNPRAPPLT